MIDTPEVLETAARPIAVLHLTVPGSEMQKVMGPGLAELKAAVAAQGIAAEGAWFTHHFKIERGTFDFEICVPVTAPVAATGRVEPSERPAMKAARTVYRGPYEKLGAAWGEFDAWVAANGHAPAADLWERYLVGPDATSDPAGFQTELTRPLIAR